MGDFTPEEMRVVAELSLEELVHRYRSARDTEEGARQEKRLCLKELKRRGIQVNREAEG